MRGSIQLSIAVMVWLSLLAGAVDAQQKTIAVGEHHALAVKGRYVWAWGGNSAGQVGEDPNTLIATLTPQKVAEDILPVDVEAVAAGGSHSLALDANGVVWAWGDNSSGQLGDGTTTAQYSPIEVNQLSAGITAICAGESFSLALDANGVVWAWGDNSSGQLGDGTTTAQYSPIEVNQLSAEITAICSGESFSLALDVNGLVWGWGDNRESQLDLDSDSNNVTVPTQITEDLATTILGIGAGQAHSLVLDTNGVVWAWGNNTYGQLGSSSESPPVEVVWGQESEIVEILAGRTHSLAVDDQGGLWAWGDNRSGQLGNGGINDMNRLPESLALSDVNQVVTGLNYNLALDETGVAWGWGLLDLGVSGLSDVNQVSPTAVDGFPCILTITSGTGGQVSDPEVGEWVYGQGESVTLTAEPNDYYSFAGWTGSAVDQGLVADASEAGTTLTVYGDQDVQANFEEITYSLTVVAATGGTVTEPGEGTFTGYTHADPITLKVERASDNYSFSGWELIEGEWDINDANLMETTLTMVSDCTIQPVFTEATPVTFGDDRLKDIVIQTLEEEYSIIVDETPNDQDMLKLLVLDASGADINDLTGLETAVNLTSLNLNDNDINDVNSILALEVLEELFLSGNENFSLSSEIVDEMTQLTVLHLNDLYIPKYTLLNELTHLRILCLNNTNQVIQDIPKSWLTVFDDLEVLSVRQNQGLSKTDTNVKQLMKKLDPIGGAVLVDN